MTKETLSDNDASTKSCEKSSKNILNSSNYFNTEYPKIILPKQSEKTVYEHVRLMKENDPDSAKAVYRCIVEHIAQKVPSSSRLILDTFYPDLESKSEDEDSKVMKKRNTRRGRSHSRLKRIVGRAYSATRVLSKSNKEPSKRTIEDKNIQTKGLVFNRPVNEYTILIIDNLCKFINCYSKTEGMFRANGNFKRQKILKSAIDSGKTNIIIEKDIYKMTPEEYNILLSNPNITIDQIDKENDPIGTVKYIYEPNEQLIDCCFTTHDACNVLKDLLRSIPNGLFNTTLDYEFIIHIINEDIDKNYPNFTIRVIQSLIAILPDKNKKILTHLLKLLNRIDNFSNFNKMNDSNLSIIFYPILFPNGLYKKESIDCNNTSDNGRKSMSSLGSIGTGYSSSGTCGSEIGNKNSNTKLYSSNNSTIHSADGILANIKPSDQQKDYISFLIKNFDQIFEIPDFLTQKVDALIKVKHNALDYRKPFLSKDLTSTPTKLSNYKYQATQKRLNIYSPKFINRLSVFNDLPDPLNENLLNLPPKHKNCSNFQKFEKDSIFLSPKMCRSKIKLTPKKSYHKDKSSTESSKTIPSINNILNSNLPTTPVSEKAKKLLGIDAAYKPVNLVDLKTIKTPKDKKFYSKNSNSTKSTLENDSKMKIPSRLQEKSTFKRSLSPTSRSDSSSPSKRQKDYQTGNNSSTDDMFVATTPPDDTSSASSLSSNNSDGVDPKLPSYFRKSVSDEKIKSREIEAREYSRQRDNLSSQANTVQLRLKSRQSSLNRNKNYLKNVDIPSAPEGYIQYNIDNSLLFEQKLNQHSNYNIPSNDELYYEYFGKINGQHLRKTNSEIERTSKYLQSFEIQNSERANRISNILSSSKAGNYKLLKSSSINKIPLHSGMTSEIKTSSKPPLTNLKSRGYFENMSSHSRQVSLEGYDNMPIKIKRPQSYHQSHQNYETTSDTGSYNSLNNLKQIGEKNVQKYTDALNFTKPPIPKVLSDDEYRQKANWKQKRRGLPQRQNSNRRARPNIIIRTAKKCSTDRELDKNFSSCESDKNASLEEFETTPKSIKYKESLSLNDKKEAYYNQNCQYILKNMTPSKSKFNTIDPRKMITTPVRPLKATCLFDVANSPQSAFKKTTIKRRVVRRNSSATSSERGIASAILRKSSSSSRKERPILIRKDSSRKVSQKIEDVLHIFDNKNEIRHAKTVFTSKNKAGYQDYRPDSSGSYSKKETEV